MASDHQQEAPAAPTQQPSPEPPAKQTDWLKRVAIGAGVAGPVAGAIAGSLLSEKVDVPSLLREVVAAIQGPLGGYVLVFLMLVFLVWHHLKTIAKYEAIIEGRSNGHRETIREKDTKLEQAADKTISVFKGTVDRYEKALQEVNARTDQTNQQLVELRQEIRELRNEIRGSR